MIKMNASQLSSALGLNSVPANLIYSGISIDTRTLQPGNLFVAIPGSEFDGHNFVEQARERGAAAAVVSKRVDSNLPQLQVQDTTAALGLLGANWRNQFAIPMIAVTGSNGKTTLKNMIASIMVAACKGNEAEVLATQGTLNNHWGLPLTLAQLNQQHRYGVIEMGMNHFGEIEYLTKLTRPNVAAITNAAASHLEGLGDVSGVARAKGEIFSGLQSDGTAILNRDDAFYPFWREIIGSHAYLTFGLHPDADIKTTLNPNATTQQVTIQTPEGEFAVQLSLLGKHNILNALAATAAALATGIELNAIKTGLEQIKPAKGRLQLYTLANGTKIIDDTYNANPFSLQAAINTLITFVGKKIVVLGDMKELGSDAALLHQYAGEAILAAGVDLLFTYGELTANTAQAFGQGAQHFRDQKQLVAALKPCLQENTNVLVKGSRSMHMEKIVADLIPPHGH